MKLPKVFKKLKVNETIIPVIAAALLLVSGYEFAAISIWRIILLLGITLPVNILLVGRVGLPIVAGFNLFITLLVVNPLYLPLVFIGIAGLLGYFTLKSKIYDIWIGQAVVFLLWIIAKLLF